MVDPIVIGGAVTVAGAAIAAGYSYFSGNDSSADIDGDGDAELEFEGENDAVFDCNDDAEDPAYQDRARENFETEEPPEDPTPEAVEEKLGLTDVKGIGPTRAEALGRAGYPNPEDLYYASDENLTDIEGIGEYTVGQIREDIGSVDEDPSGESTEETDSNSQDSTDQESESQDSSSDEQTTSNSEEQEDTQ